jgi:hypothetical protein
LTSPGQIHARITSELPVKRQFAALPLPDEFVGDLSFTEHPRAKEAAMRVKDPIEELRQTLLYKKLHELSGEFAGRIEVFVSKIAPVLASTVRFFPYYTRHDANHGYRVTRRIEQILKLDCFDPGNPCSLGATEIFLLIASAYAHDLGMAVFPGEESGLAKMLSFSLDPGWETNSDLQNHLRKNHSKRGGDYVSGNANELQVPINLVGQLDWMMKSHNLSIPELDENLRDPFAAEERVIDIRQLSIILCIADAIEFSDTRVVDGVLDLISRDDSDAARKSYRENMKHVCVGDSLAVDPDGRIVVSGTFDDPEVLSLAHHTFDQIEEWTRGYCDIERRSQVRRLRVRPEPLQRRLELRGGRFERLGVRISKKNVIDLISSNSIWRSSAGAAVRELMQNSVEACRYRSFHSTQSDRYTPKVWVRFDRSKKTVSVRDNGCGMSERVVLSHFLTVGNSRASEKAYSTEDYAPLARLGIGFWSVFTIAERAQIETLAFEDVRENSSQDTATGVYFEVELKELKDYTVFSDRVLAPGTTVTLQLKPDIVIDEVFDEARKQLLCSEIEIELTIDSDSSAVPRSVPNVSDEDVLEAKQQRKDELGIETFQWRGGAGETELALSLAYRKTSGRPTFLDQSGTPLLFGPSGGMRWPVIAICGFRGNFWRGEFCFDLPRVGTFFANHRSPRGFEFSIDRQSLLANKAAEESAKNITQLVHSGYREFFRVAGAQNEKAIFELNTESRTGGGNVFDVFTGNQLSDAYSSYPDLLCFKLIEVRAGVAFGAARVEYLDLTRLAKQSGFLWVIQNSYSTPVGGMRQVYISPESLLPAAYQYAQSRLVHARTGKDMFVLESDRAASMLFDGDPESSVEFLSFPGLGQICIQRMTLENVRFGDAPTGMLAVVQGRWTGAIYVREFATPNGRPYVFLGRHRVLIHKSSRLKSYLEDLKSEGRLIKLAYTIALLKEDEAGFTPTEIAGLF